MSLLEEFDLDFLNLKYKRLKKTATCKTLFDIFVMDCKIMSACFHGNVLSHEKKVVDRF